MKKGEIMSEDQKLLDTDYLEIVYCDKKNTGIEGYLAFISNQSYVVYQVEPYLKSEEFQFHIGKKYVTPVRCNHKLLDKKLHKKIIIFLCINRKVLYSKFLNNSSLVLSSDFIKHVKQLIIPVDEDDIILKENNGKYYI